jgi:malonyl-CoA O-methyltransferase
MHELDQKLLRKTCDRIAASYDQQDFFCAEVRSRLLERLNLVDMQPERIVDLGAGTGMMAVALAKHFPGAELIQIDWSEAMLGAGNSPGQRLCADAHYLPLADGCADIVVSNMMLPGCAEPEQIFHETRRILKHPGLFLFSTLGPDSLRELRRAWSAVDDTPHVHAFADMHNVGDALVHAGYREPVMDVENLTITYSKPEKLFADLRAAGATNMLASRRRGLTSPRLWRLMLAELENRRNRDGRLPISLEVITGQAWTGESERGVRMYEGEARFPLSQLKS